MQPAVRCDEGGRIQFFPSDFRGETGKSIDGGIAKVLARTLSLRGRLFEIYFVRLIGTPNQNSKWAPASAGAIVQ